MTTHHQQGNAVAEVFAAAVAAHVPSSATLLVAFSGGIDSSVLLHVAVTAALRPVRAVYVDHGLHPESADWGEYCRAVCQGYGVPFTVLPVAVDAAGESPEAAARAARYTALRANLGAAEVLLTAHHEQDQLETFLLQTLRGGVRGLAAMPLFAEGEGAPHLRPLLTVPDALIRHYAATHELQWRDDPSNAEVRFDRNYLRQEVLPGVLERWPGAASAVARSARLIGESGELLDELARADLGQAMPASHVAVERLQPLPHIRRKNALRYAIRHAGLPVPSERQLEEALSALLDSREDAQPVAAWPGARIRRFRDVLWLYAEHADPLEQLAHAPDCVDWLDPEQSVQLGKVRGIVESRIEPGAGFRASLAETELSIRFRVGGERLRPGPDARERTLKNLLQESDVLPWMRSNIPLIYAGEQLLAVGDIWVNHDFAARPDESGRVIVWRDHAALFHDAALSGDGLSGNL